jgi:hypothetical protein
VKTPPKYHHGLLLWPNGMMFCGIIATGSPCIPLINALGISMTSVLSVRHEVELCDQPRWVLPGLSGYPWSVG